MLQHQIFLTPKQLLNFALYNLCKHPEYQDILREEIALTGGVEFNHQNNELPLLDSFLKETARLNPITICKLILIDKYSLKLISHDYNSWNA
jgi:cytochrome P450